MRKLKIAMISGHACIRVQKIALPLLQNGHDVHLVAQKLPSFFESYKTTSMYYDAGQLIETIKLFENSGVDLYHCHNEPSWFVSLIKERSQKPVILDIHDTFLSRLTPDEEDNIRDTGENPMRITNEERTNFQMADGLIFVSESVRDLTTDEYGLDQPSLVLPSYLPEFLYKYNLGQWLGGLVYEGKVMLPEEIRTSERWYGFDYCDYTDFARQCAEIGLDFHIYGARDDKEFAAHFKDNYVYPAMVFKDLLTSITRHDWGLVGNTLESSQWMTTQTNKFYEYIACGLPVVAINAAESSRVIEEYDIGITVGSGQELAARWREHREKRSNVIKRRNELSMDNQISKLETFYGTFL